VPCRLYWGEGSARDSPFCDRSDANGPSDWLRILTFVGSNEGVACDWTWGDPLGRSLSEFSGTDTNGLDSDGFAVRG
jgi:hypothetical protein